MKNWGAWGKAQVRDLQKKRYPKEHSEGNQQRWKAVPDPHWPGRNWTRLRKVRPEAVLDLAGATDAGERHYEACSPEGDEAAAPGRARAGLTWRALRLEAQEHVCLCPSPHSDWKLAGVRPASGRHRSGQRGKLAGKPRDPFPEPETGDFHL